ncbi:SDR family NAD(P)-dependent oxidoreductase [Mailhella massiliensis]|uniref:SDR family NAD(P)-dependent oxidoreductase n=1 Tax=Mailhella massiliensis TaxID=1903261 RepID=UPI00097D877E|nr:SDR family NAD(P)-dependent oxidoreductase [Mailhella massiliensis]
MNGQGLQGKKALVTGAGRGLGRAIALTLASRGADVACWDINGEGLTETARLIRELGRKAVIRVMDITRTAELPVALDDTVAELGGLDILVNNAGVNRPVPALEVTEECWDTILNVNLKAPFFMAQAAVKHMAHGGRIINITSSLSTNVLDKRVPYQTSKGGINVLTRALALEWAPLGITVNAVGPAIVATEMTRAMGSSSSVHPKMLLGRLVQPEEIGAAVAFLASDDAAMITGQALFVDEGWSIH